MGRTILVLSLFFALVAPLLAQHPLPGSQDQFYSYGDNYFFEVSTLPGKSPAKGRAVVSFRLSNDLLTFRKALQAYQKGGVYVATPTLYIEAVGSDGVIADRAIWHDTARVQDYEMTNSKLDFLSGAVELSLRPGVYTIKYTYNDGSPETGFTETTAPIKMDDFHSPSPAIGMPLFLRGIAGDTLVAASIDGNAPFAAPLRLYVPLASPEAPRALGYVLAEMIPGKKPTPRTVAEGSTSQILPEALGPAMPSGNTISFVLQKEPSSVPEHSYGSILTIPADSLDVGDYILALTYQGGSSSVTDSVRFSIRWENMPVSLTRSDYAIKALYPIATNQTIDSLLGFPDERRQQVLVDFWARRDPSPKTKYNEAMAEYYRRVDYAYFNFKSMEQPDGVYSDRGKIYILYGAPTDVSREMRPDASPREIWTYANAVHRKFVFTDDVKTGEYKLVEYYDL
jgi:GWxTD domain-containing protein